jgi:NAD(P)-dependent dehydrogenase (short-subunit alcohol dehydrogenase family)
MTAGESDESNKNAMSAEGWLEDKQVPAGRPGRDEDMAQAVLHFAVNQYANGQTTAIDGGYLLRHP